MDQREERLNKAIGEWQDKLGKGKVLQGEAAAKRYCPSTVPLKRLIPAALLPEDLSEVTSIVNIATRHKVPLYPISTGNNWGYGSANPAKDWCVIVDMSGMNKIIDFDTELGVITLEPGVTQRDLNRYLSENNLPFLTPVTGAGPSCSILGNALERGYGITPYSDHFGAVTSIEAVMANGRIYSSTLSALGGHEINRLYKYSPGPYIDGLFTQSNFGIVTKMTIMLARRPEKIETFIFTVKDEDGLEPTVRAVREVLESTAGITASINLMNTQRVLSMQAPYPHSEVNSQGVIPPAVLAKLAKKYGITAWTGVGALYGNKEIVSAARSVIKKILSPEVDKVTFLKHKLVRGGKRVLELIPSKHTEILTARAKILCESLNIVEGHPSEVALPLAYWRSAVTPPEDNKNPARDGCGLIWYAPLVPMKTDTVRHFVDMVREITPKYGIEPLITLTSLSQRCFDSTVPILYNRANEGAAENAKKCYIALFEAGRKAGFLPYRMGVQSMDMLFNTDQESTAWELIGKIKDAVDPDMIISPGRYSR
ncbi:4-cresol dehydrogenase [hydroxylating] flavoprotein subunit [hydrothermal vent metagenome]|uniref:4-cresol dehydrogenase [hydroxylating] flavoprotein subunit n=1 Tax=hydrothermal vent metagenome TaxID=652676 RepID=A0A3B0QVZ1_9ZZZZ